MESVLLTLEGVASVIHALGYRARVFLEEGLSAIQSANDGEAFWVSLLDEQAEPLASLDAVASIIRFRGGWGAMNEFDDSELDRLCHNLNAGHLFARTYRISNADDGYISVEVDCHVDDGMSVAAFQRRFEAYIRAFGIVRYAIGKLRRIDRDEIHARHARAVGILNGSGGDVAEAVELYRKNAHLGFAGSQNNFGDLFWRGELVPFDLALSVYWATRSSERGEPTAYLSLAEMLSLGEGNLDSLLVATQYAVLAVALLPEGKNKLIATALRDSLRERVGAEGFGYAEALAGNYRPLYSERWTMEDAPGPAVSEGPGSNALN